MIWEMKVKDLDICLLIRFQNLIVNAAIIQKMPTQTLIIDFSI